MNNELGTAAGAGTGGFMMGILWGMVIGGVVALLFAPQTGTETRQMIRERFGQMREVFRAGTSDVKQTAERTAEQVRQGAHEMRQGM